MTRQLFVHIGTHKTGTTSIQALLYRVAARLKRAGTTVPKTGCPTKGLCGHHNIGWLMRGDARAREKYGTLDDLARELKGIRTPRAVISSEDLEYLVEYPEHLRTFEEKIRAAGWEPTYILFLREPAAYAISLYNELLKSGLTIPFEDFVAAVLRDARFQMLGDWTYYLDYDLFLAKWRAAATGAIDIQSYERAKAGAGVIETFFARIGVPADIADLQGGEAKVGPFELLLRRLGLAADPAAFPDNANPAKLNISAAKVSGEMKTLARPIAEKFGPIYERLTAAPGA